MEQWDNGTMNFHIITIFPEIFESYFNESIIKRAEENGLINIRTYDLRDWTEDKHRKVDDAPFGGGAGMVMKAKPIYKAIQDLKKKVDPSHKVVLLSARGKKWTQRKAQKYSKLNDIILICGRYEEVDERVRYFIDEEISIGEYVLTGGEIPAMVVVDSVARLIPGVLGNEASLNEESHTKPGQIEYPQYTRPRILKAGNKEYAVPDVLLSGNHKEIEEWRKRNSNSKFEY
jgi:tRNA (guanine37-N1)-methyltransferase